ncbi:MAG: hypothetical protein R3D02_06945 [Hyphomicrobiales bacterium]
MTAPGRTSTAPRSLAAAGLVEADGWRLKRYVLVAPDRAAAEFEPFLPAIEKRIFRDLPDAGPFEGDFPNEGLGFVVVHVGETGTWITVWWWVFGDSLQNRVYHVDRDNPAVLIDLSHEGLVGGVHELAVVDFERRTWMAAAMASGTTDAAAYLAALWSA